jgi:hypothetical protein
MGIALALGIAVAGGYWAVCPMIHWPISILGEVDAARIRSWFPIHLVDPSWIHPAEEDDLVLRRRKEIIFTSSVI